MTVTLTNSTENITIILDTIGFDSETAKEKLTVRHTTLSGRDVPYTYGNFDTFTIEAEFITVSDTLKINEWWENQDELFIINYDQSTATVKIINDSQPIPQVRWPYWDQLQGSIRLGEI